MPRAVHALLFGATLLVAAFLRFDGLGEPSLWLDEILHGLTTKAAAAPPAKPHELRELALLPRDRALGRIAKWDEFRGRVLAR